MLIVQFFCRCKSLIAKSEIKSRARTNVTEPPGMVISQVMKNYPASVAALMGNDRDEKRVIRSVRHKLMGSHHEPSCRADIVIPESLSTTYEGESFVLFDVDDGRPEQRIIAFGTNANINVSLYENCMRTVELVYNGLAFKNSLSISCRS